MAVAAWNTRAGGNSPRHWNDQEKRSSWHCNLVDAAANSDKLNTGSGSIHRRISLPASYPESLRRYFQSLGPASDHVLAVLNEHPSSHVQPAGIILAYLVAQTWRSVLNPNLPGDMSAHEVSDSVMFPDLYEAGIAELQRGLDKGQFTSVDLVKAYSARIEQVNLKGAALHAVIEINPQALTQAVVLDAERKAKGSRGPLHGIPLLLKDNIATLHKEGLNTTAGSYALLGSEVAGDAPVAAKLREAGAIFLGKTNMSEWANFRGKVPNGFSGRGGQTLSPYYPNGDASGSSSGSGQARITSSGSNLRLASSLVQEVRLERATVTRASADYSSSSHPDIIHSRYSRTNVPFRRRRCVVTSLIAGKDEDDVATREQPEVPDYTKALDKNALKGKRLGVPRRLIEDDNPVQGEFDKALDVLRSLELKVSKHESLVLTVEFKVGVNKYIEGLRKRPQNINSLADLIRFNNEHKDKELPEPYWTDQSQFYNSEASKEDEKYYEAVKKGYQLGRTDGIDATLKKFALDAIVLPSDDSYASKAAGIAGYPLVSVPLGFLPDATESKPNPPTPLHDKAPGMPFGLCFMGTAYSEYQLIGFAYAFEQATHVRLARKAFADAIPKTQLKDIVAP
ncbi:amidase signature domain-containing protein [Boletus reticuloceps]|uniref:Amidase signature domain-containing protein n=1 Tax=Boletus reticuloceps TaxID=495285 RepID=A0A8I2YXE6_9AGAM|nr:amidase signature domain-containing protein [Boletus reticuloceps]